MNLGQGELRASPPFQRVEAPGMVLVLKHPHLTHRAEKSLVPGPPMAPGGSTGSRSAGARCRGKSGRTAKPTDARPFPPV